MKVYKLTDPDGKTRNDTQWGPGVTHEIRYGTDKMLCSSSWLHAYQHPLLAVLMNPVHASFSHPRLWVARAQGKIRRDGQAKMGCKKLTTVKEIPLPQVTDEQRLAFGMLCALSVKQPLEWKKWARSWLRGNRGTVDEARQMIDLSYGRFKTARSARLTAWYAGLKSAARQHKSKEYAAVAAEKTAVAAKLLLAAPDSAYLHPGGPEYYSAWAAEAATKARWNHPLDLIKLAKRALKY
jgi:hypothetical protein